MKHVKGLAGIWFIVIAVLIIGGGMLVFQSQSASILAQQAQVADIPQDVPITCASSTTPNVTIDTPDFYGGAAVATLVTYRKVGQTTVSNTIGGTDGGFFDADPGSIYQVMVGISTTDDDAEPYGPVISYVVPCLENPALEQQVVDDALATDLTVTARDPDDNNVITTSDRVDIDAGDIKNIKFKWIGSFEEDFGNRFCEDDAGATNALVVRYNTTEYDNVYITTLAGNRLPTMNIQISRLLTASSGYTDVVFEFPVIRSNANYEYTLVMDADDSLDPTGEYNLSGQWLAANETAANYNNITLYLYDTNRFINNDVTPSSWECGIMDEDGGEVGAVAADSLSILVTADS